MYYTVIKHDGAFENTRENVKNMIRRQVFSTFLECQKAGVFYMHGLGFFIYIEVG